MPNFLFRLALLAAVFVAAPVPPPAPPRIVAVGDVHGAAAPFASILQRAGVIDAQHRWVGGTTTLVQDGDLTDRGAGVREALDLMMALESQAAAAGGAVRVVLGNHEVMNMLDQTAWRAAHPLGYVE